MGNPLAHPEFSYGNENIQIESTIESESTFFNPDRMRSDLIVKEHKCWLEQMP